MQYICTAKFDGRKRSVTGPECFYLLCDIHRPMQIGVSRTSAVCMRFVPNLFAFCYLKRKQKI